jgi:hypothetical protein
MKIRKTIYSFIVVIVALFFALWATSLISGYSLVLLLKDPDLYIKNVDVKKGTAVRILKDLDFEEGNWSAYFVLAHDDWTILKKYRHNCYRVREKAILNQLKSTWEMTITGGDVATATSYVVFSKDGSLVWGAGVVIDEDGLEGFQSSALGWVTPVRKGAIKDSLKLFEPVIAPIVILY